MITKRDKQVIEFIQEFKVATTDTISELFYPNTRIAQRRLKVICDSGFLKREREHFTAQYYYYTSKPKQLRHNLLLTNFYRDLSKVASISLFIPEYVCHNVRADALVSYKLNNISYIAFVEVQIANTPLDVKKYEQLYRTNKYRSVYPLNKINAFPMLIAITNKRIDIESFIKVVKIDEDINLKELFYV